MAILTVCFLVIQQTGSIRDELHRVESRLDAKIDGIESRLDAKIERLETKLESIGTRFGQTEQNQARLEGEVGILKEEVTLDSAQNPP